MWKGLKKQTNKHTKKSTVLHCTPKCQDIKINILYTFLNGKAIIPLKITRNITMLKRVTLTVANYTEDLNSCKTSLFIHCNIKTNFFCCCYFRLLSVDFFYTEKTHSSLFVAVELQFLYVNSDMMHSAVCVF